jgi:predicted neuraminidase
VEDGVTPVEPGPAGRDTGVADEPEQWRVLPTDEGVRTSGEGEFSYPSAVLDGTTDEAETLIVTYTWQRRGIVEARVPLDLIR